MISTVSVRDVRLRRSIIILALHKTMGCRPVRSTAFVLATVLSCLVGAYGQACPDPAPQTSGTYRFRQLGETIIIPISIADCHPVALDLHWSNGRNNGGLFAVTFLDSSHQPIFTKTFSGFMIGTSHFPLTTLAPQLALGSRSLVSLPASVTIQTLRPFSAPASISYVVTRVSPHPHVKYEELDQSTGLNLRTSPGTILINGESGTVPGSKVSFRYSLEEVTLDEPREFDLNGDRAVLKSAFRLTLLGGQPLSREGLIWLDDAALPAYTPHNSQGIATLIYDRSVLREGAEISVSNLDGSGMTTLAERLRLPGSKGSPVEYSTEEGNAIAGIHSAARLVGATRQSLVQIELQTNRMFPPRDVPLQLQIGRQFFLYELSGNPNGRKLTVTLTPEAYAQLKEGAEIVAYYGKPDRSGFSGKDIWLFGRLRKAMSNEHD